MDLVSQPLTVVSFIQKYPGSGVAVNVVMRGFKIPIILKK
jgi:hypothetical protein